MCLWLIYKYSLEPKSVKLLNFIQLYRFYMYFTYQIINRYNYNLFIFIKNVFNITHDVYTAILLNMSTT